MARERARRRRAGRQPKLVKKDIAVLRQLALAHPNATVEDLRRLFAAKTSIAVTRETLHKYLKQTGLKRVPRAKAGTGTRPEAAGTQRYGYDEQHRVSETTRYPGCLTEYEWKVVRDLFEVHGPGKPPRYRRRTIVDACCYVVRSGCPWRMLPKDFPPWQNVYAHFRRWAEKGVFERMHDRLRAMWRAHEARSPEPTAAVLDSQSVKTSPQGGPKGFDAGKKVKGRKRHLAVDILGLLLAVVVLPADVQDRDGARPLMSRALEKYPTLKTVFVDSAYAGRCADQLRSAYRLDVEVVRRPSAAGAWTDAQLALFNPPARPFQILPKRWVVERTHSWVERPRRMAKDHDRRLDVAESWIWLTEARLLLRRLAHGHPLTRAVA